MGPSARFTTCLLVILTGMLPGEVRHPLLVLPPERRAVEFQRLVHDLPRVRWPAADANLLASLPALQRPPHRVLVELGTDEREPHRRPALDGDWWDAVVALCTAYGLEPAPASEAGAGAGPPTSIQRLGPGRSTGLALHGGPVVLRPTDRRHARQLLACGAVLVIVDHVETLRYEALDSRHGWADIGLRLRLHPAAPAVLLSEAELTWHGAQTDDGRTLGLRLDRQAVSPLGHLLTPEDPGGSTAPLRVLGLERHDRRLRLRGELALEAQTVVHDHCSLTPGAELELVVDHQRYRVALRPTEDDALAELEVLALDEADPELQLTLHAADGSLLRPSERLLDHDRLPRRWTLRFAASDARTCTLRLGRTVAVGRVVLPIDCLVALP